MPNMKTRKQQLSESRFPVAEIVTCHEDLCSLIDLKNDGRCPRFTSCTECIDEWLESYYKMRNQKTMNKASCAGCKYRKPDVLNTLCLDCRRLYLSSRPDKPDRKEMM